MSKPTVALAAFPATGQITGRGNRLADHSECATVLVLKGKFLQKKHQAL